MEYEVPKGVVSWRTSTGEVSKDILDINSINSVLERIDELEIALEKLRDRVRELEKRTVKSPE